MNKVNLLLMMLLVSAFSIRSGAQTRPMRIVSTTLVTDEVAAGLVESSRIVAMSRFSANPEVSNVSDIAKKINVFVDRDPERIVRLQPDMVLTTRYSTVDLKFLMQQTGIRYLEWTQFETIEDIQSNIRSVGQAVNEVKRAEDVIREMNRKLQAASQQTVPARRAWRVLCLAPGDWTAGTRTTRHELIRSAGLKNAAAEAGIAGNNKISPEKIIQLDPDVILIGTGYEEDANFREMLLRDPRFSTLKAVRSRRILALPQRYVVTASQFIADAALELSRRINALPD